MIKIVHIADLHLDSPFAGYSMSEREGKRKQLRVALLDVCNICREEKTDILLIAGDLFDGDFIRRETVGFLSGCFEKIPDTRIFITPGNHDPYCENSPYKTTYFPDNVHIFKSETLEAVDIPELNTVVYGYGFCSDRMREKPTAQISPRDKSKINILVGHGDLDTPGSPYYNIDTGDLEKSGIEYAALGHIHKHSGIKTYGSTACAYSGCLVGRDFGECGAKGMIIGGIDKGRADLSFRQVGESLYESIKIDASQMDAQLVRDEIYRLCGELSADASVRIIINGMVNYGLDIKTEDFRDLSDRFESLEITDNTDVVQDIDELVKEHSLRGEFARKVYPYLRSDDDDTAKKAALALKYGLEALKG